MKVKIKSMIMIEGVRIMPDAVIEVSPSLASDLVYRKKAEVFDGIIETKKPVKVEKKETKKTAKKAAVIPAAEERWEVLKVMAKEIGTEFAENISADDLEELINSDLREMCAEALIDFDADSTNEELLAKLKAKIVNGDKF